MKIIKYSIAYLKKHLVLMIIFFILNIGIWGTTILIPYITGTFIDHLLARDATTYLYRFASLILIASILQITFQYLSDYINTKLQNIIGFEAKFKLFKLIKQFPMEYFKDKDVVYLNNRINEDIDQVFNFVFTNSVPIFTSILTIVICTLILSTIDITLAFVLALLIPLYILLYFLFKKPLFKANYDMREERNTYHAHLTSQFINIKHIKVNAIFSETDKDLESRFHVVFKKIMIFFHLGYFFSNTGSLIMMIANIIIVFYGGLKVIDHTITIGHFTIINTYFSMIVTTTHFFLNLGNEYQQTKVSYNRIIELQNMEVENNGKKYFFDIDSITLNNVKFSYSERTVFSNFSYHFEKGNVYLIKGSNGIGKTTLVNLIIGLSQDLQQGSIMYNNTDISDLDMYKIRHDSLSIFEQDKVLLGSTVHESLTIGLNNVLDCELEYWCEKLGVAKTLNDLPNKYHTSLNEHNVRFSGGEIQKLLLARCFLKKASVLILDEPTSAFDNESLNFFATLINQYKKEHIIIIITHDNSLINLINGTIVDLYTM
ncbi:ATP-binding cassette domain-containing protein [Anaerocolumna jejuensis]|uniref:ATP-binding cassette domain-containing protein n=1 Tax=Anaerocolumna jejuensis TaxID=259063 RepID=UPI003F7C0AB6